MKRSTLLTLCLACLVPLGGCGIDFYVGNGEDGRAFELQARRTAFSLSQLSEDASRLSRLGIGVQGLVPDLQELRQLGGDGLSMAAAPPGLTPLGVQDPCPNDDGGTVPADDICFFEETIVEPEPGVARETQRFVLFFPEGLTVNPDNAVAIDYFATRTYADGSTGLALLIDQEAPNGTTAADLGRHMIESIEQRWYTDDNEIARERAVLGLNFRGTADDAPAADRQAVGDRPDEFYYAVLEQWLRNGTHSRVDIHLPSPATGDTDPVSGTVTETVTWTDGPLRQSREALTWNLDDETARGSTTLLWRDGGTEFEAFAVSATEVTASSRGRRGETGSLYIDLVSGAFREHIEFPAGEAIRSIEQTGTIREDGDGTLRIELTETTTLADGGQTVVEATITVDGRTVRIRYTETRGDQVESGELIVVEGILSSSLSGTVTTDEETITIDATQYADGTIEARLSGDDPDTPASPDWEADLVVHPDGTVEGTVSSEGVTLQLDEL